MNLLYRSCHHVLEWDELPLFHELGCDVFSIGAYHDPRQDTEAIGLGGRPNLPMLPYHKKLSELCIKQNDNDVIHPAFIEWADVIIVVGRPDRIVKSWKNLKGKRVIWRGIGQNNPMIERELKRLAYEGLELVRYSPCEREMPDYAGDGLGIIRFPKDPDELNGWTGETSRIMAVGQAMKSRDEYCGFSLFNKATRNMPRILYGPNNDNVTEMETALLSYGDLKEAYRTNRIMFYTGTYPAPYTLGFIEAFMTGIPIIAIGPVLQSKYFRVKKGTYEIPEIIQNGESGFYSDKMGNLRVACNTLLKDYEQALEIGRSGRKRAIELFGKETIKEQWGKVLFGGDDETLAHTTNVALSE